MMFGMYVKNKKDLETAIVYCQCLAFTVPVTILN